jgi:hypothetical protein
MSRHGSDCFVPRFSRSARSATDHVRTFHRRRSRGSTAWQRITLVLLAVFATVTVATTSGFAQRARAQRARSRNFTVLYEAIANRRMDEVRRRLPPRTQINDVDTVSNATPLTWTLTPTAAPTAEQMQIAVMLLDGGADPNRRDGGNHTAMESAVSYPWPEMLQLLISRGGDLRVTTGAGANSLLYSVCDVSGQDWPGRMQQRLEVARLLLEAGLDPTAMTPWARQHGIAAIDGCIRPEMADIARLFAQYGGRPQSALRSRNAQTVALVQELNRIADSSRRR